MSLFARSDYSDDELFQQTLRGDAGAYGRLYDRYVSQLYRYVYYRVGNKEEAEDLTETVFLKTWEAIKNGRVKQGDFRAWLYRAAHNQVIDYYRTHKQNASLDETMDVNDPAPHPEAIVQDRQKHEKLMEAMSKLDPELQQIITCRFINDMDHSEISKIMGIREGYLRVLQYRALKKLSQLLGHDQGADL